MDPCKNKTKQKPRREPSDNDQRSVCLARAAGPGTHSRMQGEQLTQKKKNAFEADGLYSVSMTAQTKHPLPLSSPVFWGQAGCRGTVLSLGDQLRHVPAVTRSKEGHGAAALGRGALAAIKFQLSAQLMPRSPPCVSERRWAVPPRCRAGAGVCCVAARKCLQIFAYC